ncbi:gluconeogenesis factor YvcK family protein [Pseudoalteromonas spongiae]|uniref:gluconeogenesis factor YvcK family protein n=1 Tax=Pseudoalteromonas spongiae TaxID=298657 RepID=UPI000C2CF45B|nr:gluconeogenesis factor YvcK family protein [Pseudoalteromonas spongiae]
MKIVCIGGGHGLSQVLDALKNMPCELTAIVTTTDNGGSTGRLRQDPSQIAFGDIRRCAETLGNPENMLTILSEQRFEQNNDLNGHCFGNILLSALSQVTHNTSDAIKIFCAMLGVKHTILPMANGPVDLVATSESGERVFGECHVDALSTFPKQLSLSKAVVANQQAVEAILRADLILLGPGSLLTSVMPPLLLSDIRDALCRTSGCRIFIENLVPEHSAVDSIPANEQVTKAVEILGYKFFDVCLTPDAFEAMDLRAIEKEQHSCTHNKSQLKHIIEQLLPYQDDAQPNYSIKVH